MDGDVDFIGEERALNLLCKNALSAEVYDRFVAFNIAGRRDFDDLSVASMRE